MKLIAAVLQELNTPLKLLELETYELEKGQVLVEYFYAGVCRSQLMEVQGHRGEDKWLPHLLGHEGVGIVREIGEGVTTVDVGDTVIVGWLPTDGIDAKPASYLDKRSGRKVNSGKSVTFATAAVVSENRIFLKPNNICDKAAVLLGCALPTGAGMVLNESNPNLNDKILILGLGGIGLSVLITLLMRGFENISIIEPNKDKLLLAKNMGARGLLAETAVGTDLLNNFDICYEASGSVAGIEKGFDLINTNGKLIFASHPPNGEKIKLDPHQLIQGKRIIGSWGGGSQPEKLAKKIEQLNHKKYLDFLLGEEYDLHDINRALQDLESGKSLRPIIRMDHYGN
jgi:S-(hydroxymethyl)glutathione dehydrogenase/alcohol dehydrogenase